MGQVYQATDTKLNRQVALKILPEAFAADPDHLARFQREAQVLASLNHPGIAAIYGLEESDDTRALVLELVDGPTLADRIKQGPIPVDEALPIAKQIAEALEAAHEAGVIHRDLKPANIKVRVDGTVKVLDFGLAKALDPSQSPTLTAAATQMGVIMGTAAYMSPEQASGKPVDKRSDIWSFGVVLFEMLAGDRVFKGETVSHVLARVLDRDPDWQKLPRNTPVSLQRLLTRCLDRKVGMRLRDIGEARVELGELIDSPVDGRQAAPLIAPRRDWTGRSAAAVLGITLGFALGVGFLGQSRSVTSEAPVSRLSIPLPLEANNVDVFHKYPNTMVAISPDGSVVVFVGGEDERLHLRSLDDSEVRVVPGTEGARNPFFSPDGGSVGFFTRISDFAVVPYRQDQSPRLDFWGSDVRNLTTEGDTRWVNYNTSHFSSRSTAS